MKIVITKHAKKRIRERLFPRGNSLSAALYKHAVEKMLISVAKENYKWLIRGNKIAAVFSKINDKERPVAIFEGDDTTVYIKTVYTECQKPYEITKESTHTDLVIHKGIQLLPHLSEILFTS